MRRELGSRTDEVRIVGGDHDGQIGVVVAATDAGDCQLLDVRLPDGTVVVVARELTADTADMARERGS